MTERNAVDDAIDRMAEVFGNPGKAALRLFLDSLPLATIHWGELGEWVPAQTVVQKLHGELAGPKQYRGMVIRHKNITRELVQAHRKTAVFAFGDNMARQGYGGQAKEMRGEPNAIGVPTKWAPYREMSAYFTDADLDDPSVISEIVEAFRQMSDALASGRNVVIPADGLGTGLADLPRRAPRIHRYIEERIAALEALSCQ